MRRNIDEHYRCIQVVDPSTGQLISVDDAIQKGIFDPAKGKYFNVKTGELLTVQEAVARNLMITSAQVLKRRSRNFHHALGSEA